MSTPSRAKIQTRNSQRLASGKDKLGKSILHRPAVRYKQFKETRSKSPVRYNYQTQSVHTDFKPISYPDSPIKSVYDQASDYDTPTPPVKFASTGFECEVSDPLLDILNKLAIDQFLPIFNANHVTIEDLPLLSKQDLIDMKLPIGPRNRLMKYLEKIQQDDSTLRNLEYEETLEPTEQMTESEYAEELETQDNIDMFDISRINTNPDEVFENKCKNLEEMLLQISNQQLDMMKVIAQQQKAIKLLSNPQSPAAYDPEEDIENIHVKPYQKGSTNSSFIHTRQTEQPEERSLSPFSRLKRRDTSYSKPTLNSLIRKKVMPSKFMRVSPLRVAYRLKNMQ